MQTIKELGAYTFQAVLKNSVARFANRPCCNFTGEKPLTYKDVQQKIFELQDLFYDLNISRGSKVAIYAKNSPNWIISYFAIVTMGAVAIPLLPDFSREEVESCLEHSEADCVLVGKEFLDEVPKNIKILIQLDAFSILKGEKSSGKKPVEEYIADENDMASIIYTSGTTGRSKGVVLTNKNLVSNAISGQYCYRVSQYDRFFSILPLAHVYEFTVGFMMGFLNGSHLVYLQGPPIPRILMPALKLARPNIMLAVPLIMEKIYKNMVVPEFNKTPFRKKLLKFWLFRKIFSRIAGKKINKAMGGQINFFGIGGAKLDTDIEKFLKMAGFPYAIGYGLTETSPLLIYSPPSKTVPGFVGAAANGVELKIINKNEEGVGELVAKGPNIMQGYLKAPDLTKASFTEDGYFKTGDLFSLDKKGRYTFRGRLKNMILDSSGENIYPEDIEFVLNQHEIVSESLVVQGENHSLTALIKLNEEKLRKLLQEKKEKAESQTVKEKIGSTVNTMGESLLSNIDRISNEIQFFVNSKVNSKSKINKVEIIGEFEKTASGKIKRYFYDSWGGNKKDN